MHPACDPAALGRATHLDFRLFAGEVARLGGGGVYLNVGSAVVLPEVFLKAVTLARNLGHRLDDFATANLDFIQSYRPGTNVVERPVQGAGPRLPPHRPPRAPRPAPRGGAGGEGRPAGGTTVKSQGRLEEEDFPDLVRELSQQRWTGVLRLEKDGERIGITVEDGHLVFASTSNADYRLGPRLLRRGVITLRQMEDAGRAMSPGKRFGTVLVDMGFLDPKELVRGVVDQTRDIILLAFHWTAGEYALEPGPAPGEAITLDMSTPQLILDGISQIEAWSRVERGLGRARRRATRRWRAARASSSSSPSTSTRPGSCARSRAPATSSRCARESVLNHFEVCRTLWAFRVIGLVRRVEAATPLDDDGLEFVLPA